MDQLTYSDITAAAGRISGRIRPVALAPAEPEILSAGHSKPPNDGAGRAPEVWLALEHMQHTGSFKPRGALNFLEYHRQTGGLPDAGVTIASGGNAGLAYAWAARQRGVTATVFIPKTTPTVKVTKLRSLGADVHLVGGEYAEAQAACAEFASGSGALASHAYDHPLVAAGAGTLLDEIHERIPDLDTVVVAVGGGGLVAGIATAAHSHGIRTVAVEPENCRALNAAVEAGRVVDVTVKSIAADSLGARRVSRTALRAAQHRYLQSVLVTDGSITEARQALWDSHKVAVEYGSAASMAALVAPLNTVHRPYQPSTNEKICLVLCGANTDPGDLA